MFKWGDTELLVLDGTYTEPWAESPIVEIPLAPDPAALSAVSTVTQQQGRKRETVSFSAYVKDKSVWQGFVTDQISGTVRTFIGPDDYSASMFVFNVSPATRKIHPTRFEFSVTLMEATE